MEVNTPNIVRPNPTLPRADHLSSATNQELTDYLATENRIPFLVAALVEANKRKDKQIADLAKRIEFLEEKALKKAGRKKEIFYFNGQELSDDYLLHLVDDDMITIYKLEKDVNAGKNQLRNRYNKAKRQQRLERQVSKP